MAASDRQRTCDDYHVAWICAVADLELLPARLMLDEEHPVPPYDTHYDENTYICGSISGHAVVVATCPPGETGNVNAGRLTGSMFKTFRNIRMAVLVGIGGGIPGPVVSEDSLDNIHLGDVVVGWPGDGKPACVYHDRGRSKVDGHFEMVGTMQNADWRLTNALGVLASDHELGRTTFDDQLARLQRHKKKRKFAHPGVEHDKLFKPAYRHNGDYTLKCTACDPSELVERPQRTEEDQQTLVFHRGRIATGNAVIQDGELRDEIGARCDRALCVEMEAAGVDANRRCLVVRGISNYADSHNSDMWRSHAAGNAAAFTRELLCRVQPDTVKKMEGMSEAPWLVPLPRPRSFVGREAQLARLNAHISSQDCRRLAVYGLGGCGKTALALETAYRTREQHPMRAVFWVPVVSQASFEQAYREIGELLRIPGIADAEADVKQLVKARLSDEGFGQWLMVVDNADDVGVLFDAFEKEGGADRLVDYLPRSRKGSFVFTSRTRKAAVKLAESDIMALSELEQQEAEDMLRQRLPGKELLESNEVVHEFLTLLTYLPLAIVQAVAFVVGNNARLSDYIAIYKSSETEATDLLSKDFEDQGRYRQIKNPVAVTWYISFSQIRERNRLAAAYLSLMACTTGEDVPASLLWPGSTMLATTEALGTLSAYAFVTERQQQQSATGAQHREWAFNVHRLVRLATHNWLKEHGWWPIWPRKALARLVEVVPFGEHDTREAWTAYLPHAVHVAGLPEVYDAEERVSLLERVGRCEQTLGRYRAAERAHRQVLDRRERALGKKHLDTLTSMNEVGVALSDQGKYADAEQMHRETLALKEEVLGKKHPETLTSMNNLAGALNCQGKYADAKQMHRETLALKEEVLGKKHPETLTSMNNLAGALNCQGKYADATQMHREELVLRNEVSGKRHPHTLISMNNLALALSRQGNYADAEQMHREALALKEEVLGKKHPSTLTSMNNLAGSLSRQGKYADAEQMHREALALKEEVLGKKHPKTLTSMSNLAGALSNQGKYAEAVQMHQEELVLREEVSGKRHPHTLTSMNNLALVLNRQGKYADAEQMHREVLGKKYPETLTSVRNLALLAYQ
ncbi:kinesin light chain [Macroventuria anomochaeta]|uniref:Kinesin light chain n=1 Tax=Macroventuria anomochaeta TaxID=301207 RepID=A0ACB6RSA5_9PLEO|nr:kinesin light chain [Macroventuria anomochaeta]KAF2624855.1 kinesin light chain [Macroventuria anomochaeta]